MSLLFALSLLGCSQIEAMMGTAPPAAKVETAPPVEVAKPGASSPMLAGKYAEALPELEKALAATPTDDSAWDAVEIAATRGAQGGALLDRLSADTAIGGRVDRHQALRAELALANGRAADALAAARLLEVASPGDGAALTVRALQAGAPTPEGLPPVVVALHKAATDPKAPFTPEIDALPGARAALLRAEIKAARADVAGALLQLDAATATGLLGQRVALARLSWETDAVKSWASATAATEAATKAQDLVGAAKLLDAGKLAAYRQWKPQAALDAATAGRKGAEEMGNLEAAGWFATVQADANLHLGMPVEAKTAAEFAAAQPPVAAAGKWRLALAHAMLGDARSVAAAAAGLPEADAARIRALAAAMTGSETKLPSEGLTGDDAGWQALLGAGWVTDTAGTASRAGAMAQSPDLALWAQLWATRGVITGAPETPQMASENAVRAWVRDGTAGAVVDEGHPYAKHWRLALSHGTAPASEGDVAAYARLIASVEGAFADQAGAEMNELSAVLPDWRSGPLAPVLVSDGPRAIELERLVRTPSRLTDDDALSLRVSWHAWRQRDEDRARLWAHGVSPVAAGLGTPDRLLKLWSAMAKQRAATLAWLSGAGAYPAGSGAEIDAVAVELKLLPRRAGALADIRTELGRSALISFVPTTDGAWEGLYLTDHNHLRVQIPAKAAQDVTDYVASLASGKASLALGNKVRAALLDPAAELLTGYGNYYIIGPAPLGSIPVDALPEQSEGKRYLAAIRHPFYYPNFAAMTSPTFEDNDFATSMLAICGDAAGAEAVKRIYPDAVVLQGAAATRDAWLKEAPRSRYLHFQGLTSAPSGGFVLPAGGNLELSDIAATPLVARVVAIVGPADPGLTLARLSALRAAGAGDFFATGVGTHKAFNERISERFWDATNKRLPVWKALSEPRMQIATEIDSARGITSPAMWGGLISAGKLQ